MYPQIQLLSIDFDGTLVSRGSETIFDPNCMELIRELQHAGAIWAINTGRSVDLLETGLAEFALPIRPDFILTTERDVFRPGRNGEKWEPFGDWNQRCARDHAAFLRLIESREKFLPCSGNHAMLLQQPVYRQSHARGSLDQASERHILPGMVKAVGKIPQIVEDLAHQPVICALTLVEGSHLLLQNVEQSTETDMLGMPYGDWVSHKDSRT